MLSAICYLPIANCSSGATYPVLHVKLRSPRIAPLSLGLLLACCRFAFALNPSLDVNQYAHTVWKIREGFTKGEIISIAQTPDGYLWMGTTFGLLRFDGVRSIP